MYLASLVTSLLLFAYSFRSYLAIDIDAMVNSTSSFLSFAGPRITITLAFDIAFESSFLFDQVLLLSNQPSFDPLCTFPSLSFSVPPQNSDVHTITLSESNTTEIKTAIGNEPGIECLANINSTFLLIFPLQPLPVQLNVISDLTSPQVSNFEIDFQLGIIIIRFTEPVIIDPFNVSGMYIEAVSSSQNVIFLSNLTNVAFSIETELASENYTILLEVFELSAINAVCPTLDPNTGTCNLVLPNRNFTTDIFGNSINPSPNIIPVQLLTPFLISDWGASSVTASPLSYSQVNLTFSSPIFLRPNDTVYYRVFSFAERVIYYYGSCDYPSAYEIQLDSQEIRSSFGESLPCENASDYFCYVSNNLNLVVDLFDGIDHSFCIETVYPEFSLMTTPCTSLSISDHYNQLLNFQLTTDNGNQGPQIDGGPVLSAVENRALLTWQIPDVSFCEQHRITARYTESTNPLHNIELDSDTLCGSQYLYIYFEISSAVIQEFLSVSLDLRFTSPIDLIPNNTCRYTRIRLFFFQTNNLQVIDVPVINSITNNADEAFISWSFPLTAMDHFNVYIFPVYALRFNEDSCSSIDTQTPTDEISFFPTEYFDYGVSIPNQIQFNLTCPPSPGASLPYQCHSVFSRNNFLSVSIDPTFAVGIIVEAVLLNANRSDVLKVRSYPAIYSSWEINLGTTRGAAYQDISWDQNLCLPSSIVFFRVFDQTSFESTFIRNFITPCSSSPTFLKDVPSNFETRAYLFTNSVTADGSACLSGFESNQLFRFDFGSEPFSTVIDFKYLDFNTISLSIAILGTFNLPATVYFLPYQVHRLELANVTDQCPAIRNDTDLSTSQINIVSMDSLTVSPPLPCENTSNYSCIFVENTADITIDIIPGFDPAIRFITFNNADDTFLPGTNGIPILRDFNLVNSQSVLYTSTRLTSKTSVLVEWNTNFYCPPDAFVYLFWEKVVIPPPTVVSTSVILPCDVGSYLITNLDYSSRYFIDADVFFNSTTFFPSCATFEIAFGIGITADFIQNIQFVDFANVNVEWDFIPGVTSYTLLAIPEYVTVLTTQVNSVFSSDLVQQIKEIDYTESPDFSIDALYEMCLDSNPNLTCSKLTTASNNAILTIIPGYDYNIAVAYELSGVSYIQSSSKLFDPFESVQELIAISGFNLRLLFKYNSQICTNSTRTVFYYEPQNFIGDLFQVVPCNNSAFELLAPDDPISNVLFIFPYQPLKFPGSFSVITNPVHIVIDTTGLYSYLPQSASPLLTSLVIPMDPSSNVYRAEWTNIPVFQIPQQFESYILYALPTSNAFTLTGQECPQYIYPDCFLSGPLSLGNNRSLIFDICPGYGSFYFFCEEFGSSLQGELSLFPFLDYFFFVEAVYDGGLRTSNFNTALIAKTNQSLLESLRLTYLVSTSTIEISWDTTPVFCVDSTISFIFSTQVDPSIVVDCQTGVYLIDSLRSRTEYEVYVYFNYNPTRLYPGREQCIRSNPQIAFNPSPITSSICLTLQPCGVLGMCSEGYSNSSFYCDCLAGYGFDGNACVDMNECNSDITPCADSACVNSEGSFNCICFNGYTMVNGECVDINECDFPENCVNGNCSNFPPPENYICKCEPSYEGRNCNISVGIPACPSFTEQNDFGMELTFPATPIDTDAIIPCSQLDGTLFGTISRRCNGAGVSEITNYQNCVSAPFLSLQSSAIDPNILLTGEESVMESIELVTATSAFSRGLYPGELMQVVAGLQAIRNSLLSLTGDELIDTLSRVQDNIVLIASNVFGSENRIAFITSPQTEVESEIDNIVATVETLGILLGSVIPVNSSILIEEQNVALVVTVVSDPIDAIFIGPNSIPNSFNNPSALSRAQASVLIPASVIRANDVGRGVEVSFSVFPNIAQLLGEVEADVARSPRQRSVNDTLSTAVSNLNIFARGGGRVEQLNEDILLSFGLLFDPPLITNFVKFSLVYTCVSSQRIDEGWVSDGTTLSNSIQVPPGPAQCSVSHLTNFAVLGSVVSLNLTPGETLAIEILSYLLGSISIIFLMISVLAYIILWFRTRKQATSLFKKDATILHFNFAVALLLALLFFVSSAGAYNNRTACLVLTILQYYFWLAVFTASLVVGLYLLIKILAWDVERRFSYFLVPLSWGLPIPLVIITPSITHEYIIDDIDEVCWLSNEPTFVSLAFVIPMTLITLLNLVFLILTAIILFKVSKGKENKFRRLRSVLIATLALAPLLGIPWLFSVVANIPTPATAFIFTIIIGLQGVIFSILYPLSTPEIIKYVFLWKPVQGTYPTTTNTSSNPNSSKPPAALKFRINRRGASQDPISNNNVTQPIEAKNEYLGIQLEPVTIENSLLHAQSQRAKDMQSTLTVRKAMPHFSTSISVPGEEVSTPSSSIKVPYESLS